MSPREERRFRLVWVVMVPYAMLVAVLATVDDWSVGWIWLAVLLFFAIAVVFVHARPGDRPPRR